MQRYKCNTLIIFVILFFTFIGLKSSPNALTIGSQQVKIQSKFLENISGKNRFIFNIKIENPIEGIVKEFFIENDNKITPIPTYQISNDNYIVIVNSNSNSISDVKLGINTIVNRSQQTIRSIGTLSAENKNFRSGEVVGDPVLLYHKQNKIFIALEIDDPWDTLKNIQATLVYPELRGDFNTSFEIKYILRSNTLKQYVYITLDGFQVNKPLKFNLNLLFEKSMNDVSLKSVSRTFPYNFDKGNLTEDLVKNVYSVLLGKNISSVKLKEYKSNLLDHKISPSEFIIGIVEGVEFSKLNISDDEFINRIYKIVLNRDADKDGKNYWIGEIRETSRIDVLKKILISDEYVRRMREIGLKI